MDKKIMSVLNELNEHAEREKNGEIQIPREEQMLSITEDTGKFLNILCKGIGAKHVLEIGTSVGFSTIWLAEAIKEKNGKVITIEQDQEKIKRAKENFKNAGISDYVQTNHYKALDLIKKQKSSIDEGNGTKFDLVFIDADKENLKEYFDILIQVIKINGIIVTDNILYPEKFRPIMLEYKQHVESMTNVRTVTVPIGNGEEVSIKIV
ncbi:MAG: methyltransferase domain-containing protein [Nitrosopumilaceae archaeon]|nr:O-methyltransferase [Nitrosopumilaceae archaeon]NIU02482.1 O-methyltransferase [Nitrosopumilaceae archaeon]NIU88943.1 methyltransferase domain-containing protein [Nitrosopumilaceae archaeon]NIV67054.1 methyltransferase domain-containing protein [Nitrosopumilaceae archaeon]NIX63083.1 methyltransferase domain-containing protein [Nitrosopumilaceae archaeon]